MCTVIEFEDQTFEEDDDSTWSATFVRINGGDWIMASKTFGTDDELIIKEMILNGEY